MVSKFLNNILNVVYSKNANATESRKSLLVTLALFPITKI